MEKVLFYLLTICTMLAETAATTTLIDSSVEQVETGLNKKVSQEQIQATEKSRQELEKLIKNIDPSQLQLMAGVQWPAFKRASQNGDRLFKENKFEESNKNYQKALKFFKQFSADNKLQMLSNGDMKMGKVTLHSEEEQVSFMAKTELIEDMPIEVLVCTDRGRIHETIFITEARPFHIQTLLHAMGAKNGARIPNDKFSKQGDFIRIMVEWTDTEGKTVRKPIEHFMTYDKNKKLDIKPRWVFVGSGIHKGAFVADWSGDVAVNFASADSVIDCAQEDIANLKISLSSWFPPGMKSGDKVKIIISVWKNAKSSAQEQTNE